MAYKNKIKEIDALVHGWIGNYGISALTVSIASCFGDKKAKYIEKPMFEEFDDGNLTQEEIDNKELQKMLLAEEMWIKQQKKKGLPETVIL